MTAHASEIWDMVLHSRHKGYRLRLGEVTATEYSFFKLREFWTKSAYIVTNEPDEATTGADWEWLIGHDDKWIQIRVQAKILDKSGSFKELGHPHRTGLQMDRLLNPAPTDVACRYMPLYTFYAASPPAPNNVVAAQNGCSVQLADRVRDTYKPARATRATLTSAAHLYGSAPWAEVFDGLVARLQGGESLATVVDSLANSRMPTAPAAIGDFWDPQKSGGVCQRGLPAYLKAIVERDNDEFDSSQLARLNVEVRRPTEPSDETSVSSDGEQARDRLEEALESDNVTPTRHIDQAPDEHLPSRSIVLDRIDRTPVALPRLVSVIDIGQLDVEARRG